MLRGVLGTFILPISAELYMVAVLTAENVWRSTGQSSLGGLVERVFMVG